MPPRKGKLSHRKNELTAFNKNRAKTRRDLRAAKVVEEKPSSYSPEKITATTPEPFHGFEANALKPGLRVVSLFDGISSLYCALQNLKIHVEVYYSSEVDSRALQLQKHRFGDKITPVGDVTKLSDEVLQSFGHIDLLVGGSPCTHLSLVNPRRLGLNDPSGTGSLFFQYVRIRNFFIGEAAISKKPFYWLFENTFHMEIATKKQISRHLGCHPVELNASKFIDVERRRLFWGNLPNMDNPPDVRVGEKVTLQDVLAFGRSPNVVKVPTLTTSYSSQKSGKDKQLPVIQDGDPCPLFITEWEKLMGFPESFTDGPNLSITDRRQLLGKAFCVPVVQQLVAPLQSFFWVRDDK